ncbi:MAG: hypothetical protein ACEY3K_02110 [Wolbachia sp.]
MDRGDIPEILFSSIKEDDPYRASKLLQIERWCYAHWKLHQRNVEIGHNFIAQALSSEDCWKKVDALHEVKLDRHMVGKKLLVPKMSDGDVSPLSFSERYRIACECCLEDEIRAIFEERKEELSAQGRSSLLEYNHLVKCCGEGPLAQFWSHFISGYLDKLDLRGRHPYEYGLDCAVDWQQVEAVEFFWDKIKSLSENEMSAKKKDRILMKNAAYTAGPNFGVCPDIFEFFLDQINPNRYPELLKRDLGKNGHYGSLNRMIDMLSFDKFQELFNHLEPGNISENRYHTRLCSIEIQNYSGHYVDAAKKLFMYLWTKEGFDSHRALVINEEVMDKSPFFHKNLLVRWVERDCMEPVWAVLDKLDSNQIKKYMTYKEADYIRSVLEQRDDDSPNKFLFYSEPTVKNLDEESVSANLAAVELSNVHDQSCMGLGDH